MPDNREERIQAVKYARASIELEGFTLSALDEQHAADYIDGRIALDEFITPRVAVAATASRRGQPDPKW